MLVVVRNSTYNDPNFRRRQLARELYELLEEMEVRSVKRMTTSGFPFSLLARIISSTLGLLERAADRLVMAVLSFLKSSLDIIFIRVLLPFTRK